VTRCAGILLVVLALAVAVIPQFSNCYAQGGALVLQSGKTVPMKCYWTARAEIAAAVPLLLAGVLLVVSRGREAARSLSILGVVGGGVVLALPAYLIGVCTTTTMICYTVMSPALRALGSAIIATSVAGLMAAQRSTDSKS